jgi:hypothetical protein
MSVDAYYKQMARLANKGELWDTFNEVPKFDPLRLIELCTDEAAFDFIEQNKLWHNITEVLLGRPSLLNITPACLVLTKDNYCDLIAAYTNTEALVTALYNGYTFDQDILHAIEQRLLHLITENPGQPLTGLPFKYVDLHAANYKN